MSTETPDPLCNLCGLTCVVGREGGPDNHPEGLLDAVVTGGYESTPGNGWGALDDMTRHRFNLCEFCLDWLFACFVIPVAVDDPMNDFVLREGETVAEGLKRMGIVRVGGFSETRPWRPAAARVADDDWRSMKDAFTAEAARRSAARRTSVVNWQCDGCGERTWSLSEHGSHLNDGDEHQACAEAGRWRRIPVPAAIEVAVRVIPLELSTDTELTCIRCGDRETPIDREFTLMLDDRGGGRERTTFGVHSRCVVRVAEPPAAPEVAAEERRHRSILGPPTGTCSACGITVYGSTGAPSHLGCKHEPRGTWLPIAPPTASPDVAEEEPHIVRAACRNCGENVRCDEDGCCASCGRDCTLTYSDGEKVEPDPATIAALDAEYPPIEALAELDEGDLHRLPKQITFLRENCRNDGAEGETVHAVCRAADALIHRVRELEAAAVKGCTCAGGMGKCPRCYVLQDLPKLQARIAELEPLAELQTTVAGLVKYLDETRESAEIACDTVRSVLRSYLARADRGGK